jgi:hypothetical protein
MAVLKEAMRRGVRVRVARRRTLPNVSDLPSPMAWQM